MKIPYNKTRQLSTAELPGVLCDPILTFVFVANPPYQLVQEVSLWLQDKSPDWVETRRLAALLIKAVITPDGSRYELKGEGDIEDLAEQTDQSFIANLLNGWNVRLSLERMAEVKKLRPSLAQSSTNDGEKARQ